MITNRIIMAEEKPKYIRKKCEHGKYTFQCKECKGSCICIHGKHTYICKDCDGKGICEHNRIKQQCKECSGASICIHDKRRIRCAECKGGSICPHQKIKSRCAECSGSEMCSHRRRKEICIECIGSQICPHKLRKSRCIECGGSEICIHGNNKHNCIACHGKNICEHSKLRYQCIDCHGNRTCIHDKRTSACITCTPSGACQHCKAISIIGSQWKPYCFRCYCVLHPDAIIPRKYKLKEHHVVDYLKKHFQDTFTMRFDKIVEGGCSRRRPDVFIDFGSHCLVIEIDENRHINYTCEEKRMIELYEDIGFRKIVFLRMNPDQYKEGNHKHPSPFRYTRAGILHLEETEFDRRMQYVVERTHIYQHEPSEPITIEYLFYGS